MFRQLQETDHYVHAVGHMSLKNGQGHRRVKDIIREREEKKKQYIAASEDGVLQTTSNLKKR